MRRHGRWLVPVLALGLLAVCILAAGIGAVRIPPSEVVASLLHKAGLDVGYVSEQNHAVLWAIRFPRVVLGILVGVCLGCAGAAMQGVFGNPLAEPAVIGVSSGAAIGAVAAIVLGITSFGSWTVTAFAFLGGLVTTLTVYLLSRSNGRTEVVTLILTGVAVNALAGAGIGMLTFIADDAELRSITFWNLGSLGGANWDVIWALLPFALIALFVLPFYARSLDLLALGERGARHLGVDTERVRLGIVVLTALLVGAAVAAAGVVGFIGLVVPHLIRLIAGPRHALLLPAGALLGAIVTVAADLASRTVALPAEVPLGVLTALLGAPFFLWLLRRTRSKQGGWA
ncbi:iron ABC transporter permease [Yinghuangia sp. KLBMP8922]|uniref:Iron ABC transporter permease n=1 Tax=Yinghuangia soli TaxID=2908204 RepID=A0AA41PVG6_9ACTN|nr:iron ABC transporter permease [Yinghuangia soli]MCF2525639.1 iron ABC transporter permease [Yinghuangia soli]